MHALLVEAVPAIAFGVLAVALAVLLAVIFKNVVLAGNEEHILGGRGFKNLVDGVELRRLGEVADVAGVQNECRRHGQRVDLADRGFQGRNHVGVRGLVESHVAVADLDETEFALRGLCDVGGIVESVGLQHSTFEHAEGSGAGPRHAFQESSAVDSVVVVVERNCVMLFLRRHSFLSFLSRTFETLSSGRFSKDKVRSGCTVQNWRRHAFIPWIFIFAIWK